MTIHKSLLSCVAILLVGCGDSGREDSVTATAPMTGIGPTQTASDAGTTAADTGGVTSTTGPGATTDPGDPTTGPGGDPTGGGPKFDVPNENETANTTAAAEMGCKKVDFLFVIDNSASMEDNQAALIASFPGFITAIQSTLTASDDYHIMVVDSDDDGRCKQPCDPNGPNYQEFCSAKSFHACKAALTACDTTRGAGVVHPVGLYATNAVCPIAGGNRYMLPEEPDLLATFSCVAKVGTAGNPSERPMNGMTEAVSAALNGPGGCNAGFLRDDAILVVTFISDDPNYEDQGTPQEWHDALVAAKGGNKDAIVVAGLIPLEGTDCPGGNGDIKGVHWKEFIDMFGARGIAGKICEPDYAPFFAQAVGIIDEACDNFNPPG